MKWTVIRESLRNNKHNDAKILRYCSSQSWSISIWNNSSFGILNIFLVTSKVLLSASICCASQGQKRPLNGTPPGMGYPVRLARQLFWYCCCCCYLGQVVLILADCLTYMMFEICHIWVWFVFVFCIVLRAVCYRVSSTYCINSKEMNECKKEFKAFFFLLHPSLQMCTLFQVIV